MATQSVKKSVTEYYLSVRQPYAWAIVAGIKDVENRDWSTKIRGRIFIHAGKNKKGLNDEMDYIRRKGLRKLPKEEDLVFGAIIGSVEIVDCVEKHSSKWHLKGKKGFLLTKPRELKTPIPMKGNAKMQRVPTEVLKKIQSLIQSNKSRLPAAS